MLLLAWTGGSTAVIYLPTLGVYVKSGQDVGGGEGRYTTDAKEMLLANNQKLHHDDDFAQIRGLRTALEKTQIQQEMGNG